MKNNGPDDVSPEVLAQLERLAAMSDDDIDLSDAPEVTDWGGARRGLYSAHPKRVLSVSLDADLIEYVETTQADSLDERLNALLREWVGRAKQAAE